MQPLFEVITYRDTTSDLFLYSLLVGTCSRCLKWLPIEIPLPIYFSARFSAEILLHQDDHVPKVFSRLLFFNRTTRSKKGDDWRWFRSTTIGPITKWFIEDNLVQIGPIGKIILGEMGALRVLYTNIQCHMYCTLFKAI